MTDRRVGTDVAVARLAHAPRAASPEDPGAEVVRAGGLAALERI